MRTFFLFGFGVFMIGHSLDLVRRYGGAERFMSEMPIETLTWTIANILAGLWMLNFAASMWR